MRGSVEADLDDAGKVTPVFSWESDEAVHS